MFTVAVLACVLIVGEAKNFMESAKNPDEVQWWKEKEVIETLALELEGQSKHRHADFKEMLRESFASWPKNQNGYIEHQTAQYALHRLFVQRHSWYIKGLEPNGDAFVQNTSAGSLGHENWVPSYLLEQMERRLKHRGLDLDDLAALAAALEDLVYTEAADTLNTVYAAKNLSTDVPVNVPEMQKALDIYMVMFLASGQWNLQAAMSGDFAGQHDYWAPTEKWFRGIEARHLSKRSKADSPVDFATAVSIAVDIGAQYGSYNDVQCRDLKATLLNASPRAREVGRISLSKFYKAGMEGQWSLNERVEYLRAMGAADEGPDGLPRVIIPNYITARPNCLQSTGLYAVCCRNECEDLMGALERGIGKPSAKPLRILALVSALRSDTVEPRHISADLESKLHGMAIRHGGEVRIHGRLFAQWMHHAFPNECPYPHEAGEADPITPDEWMGAETSASKEHIAKVVAAGADEATDLVPDMPWTDTEELLGSKHVQRAEAERTLAFELEGKSKARLEVFKQSLTPLFASLPKTGNGNLEHQTARYVLHRLFVQWHSWNIKGLEPVGHVF